MVEIITREEPYSECKGVYARVTNPLALQFIQLCIKSNPDERPSADELLRHPFLEKKIEEDDEEVTLGRQIYHHIYVFLIEKYYRSYATLF